MMVDETMLDKLDIDQLGVKHYQDIYGNGIGHGVCGWPNGDGYGYGPLWGDASGDGHGYVLDKRFDNPRDSNANALTKEGAPSDF